MARAKTIELFMWGWQEHFRINLESLAGRLFEQIGLKAKPTVLLVGVLREGMTDAHPVCIEPESGRWGLSIFEGLTDAIEKQRREHPDREIFHTHPSIMEKKPERILRDAISGAVREALDAADGSLGLRTFCCPAVPVDKHYVVCALQVPEAALSPYPTFPYEWLRQTTDVNFALRAIDAVLHEGQRSLELPEAAGEGMRSAAEVATQAAEYFMRASVIPGQYVMTDAFRLFNQLSQLPYESARGKGRIVIAKESDERIDYAIKFADPVPIRKVRWIRKLLEMSTAEMPLIASYEHAFGLGRVAAGASPLFYVDFVDQHEWLFKQDDATMLHSRFGEPTLPRDVVDPERFADTLTRLFPSMAAGALAIHQAAVLEMNRQPYGSMIVIAEDAAKEAERLEKQGTRIAPMPLTPALLNRASRIDGTILVAPDGACHAIGVILDGEANADCTPSRGARYNSGVRYVASDGARRVAIVMSEDRTLDVIPLLRPRVSRRRIEQAISALEAADGETYHQPRNRLDDLRFYLDQSQCDRVNAALERIHELPLEEHAFRIVDPTFVPDVRMDESYLVD